MSADQLFQVSNMIAMCSWILLLAISPFWKRYDQLLIGVIIAALAATYAVLIFGQFHPAYMASFGSLDGVSGLFGNRYMLTAGWIHYLAFDLFTGIWIKKNADYYGISHWLVIPCLLFCFMLGPVGLLLYLLIRWIKTGSWWNPNHLSID